jgi:hypothetical protein
MRPSCKRSQRVGVSGWPFHNLYTVSETTRGVFAGVRFATPG